MTENERQRKEERCNSRNCHKEKKIVLYGSWRLSRSHPLFRTIFWTLNAQSKRAWTWHEKVLHLPFPWQPSRSVVLQHHHCRRTGNTASDARLVEQLCQAIEWRFLGWRHYGCAQRIGHYRRWTAGVRIRWSGTTEKRQCTVAGGRRRGQLRLGGWCGWCRGNWRAGRGGEQSRKGAGAVRSGSGSHSIGARGDNVRCRYPVIRMNLTKGEWVYALFFPP